MSVQEYVIMMVATVLGWLGGNKIGKRKARAEADSVEVDNAKSVIALWKDANLEMREEMNVLKLELVEVRKENQDLARQLHEVHLENGQLREEMAQLKRSFNEKK